jgi:UDPglucose 6-dehydrogenase
MNIAIIGTGYVGLVTGACLADLGNKVICVDSNKDKINSLKKGIMPIYEPGLEELVKKNIKKKRLFFGTSIKEAVTNSEIIFIAVWTPPKPNGEPDLSYVESVACQIARSMTGYKVIVEKSTVPVETGEKVTHTVSMNNVHKVPFDVVSNPEFLREGSAIYDTMNPERIVLGVSSPKAAKIMKELYRPLNAPILLTDIKSAEIIKHASNSFLAMKISFINAVANISELVGADVVEVAQGMGYDKRIGKDFLKAGIGYGGSCFPKDIKAFIKLAEKAGYDFRLLEEVEHINDQQRKLLIKKIEKALWNVNNKTVGILGLAFKPDTDDMRNAPSIEVIKAIQQEGAKIQVYDPVAMPKSKQVLKGVKYCKNGYEAAKGADLLVVITDWNEFKELDLVKIKKLMKHPVIIDGRNIYDPGLLKKLGFAYTGMGRRR